MSRPLCLLALCVLAACAGGEPALPEETLPFTPDRPALGTPGTVPVYGGENALVQEAQARYVTGLDLHRKFILRTCGPTNGVCHNQKEYPDLHTAGTFSAAIGAPCNVQPGDWSNVFDRCELLGDRFRFADGTEREVEIGWIEYVPGEWPEGDEPPPLNEATPGLHLVLHSPLSGEDTERWDTGLFIRSFVNDAGDVTDVAFASFRSNWFVLPGRTHLVARVQDYQLDAVTGLLRAGIVQGDANRNGVYGARSGSTVSLITPGRPEESYLVARLRGHMLGEPVPGSRMPLANQPPSITDMLALMCFIEALPPGAGQDSLAGPINYADCSYSANPESLNLVGEGVTWSGRIRPLLAAHCGGCHNATEPQGGLDLVNDAEGQTLYQRLMGPSLGRPDLKLVQPGVLETSYLWLKLAGDGSIVGQRMPLDPLGTSGTLPDAAMNDISAWILGGALEQ